MDDRQRVKSIKVRFFGGQGRIGSSNLMTVKLSSDSESVRWGVDFGAEMGLDGKLHYPYIPPKVLATVNRWVLTHLHADHYGYSPKVIQNPATILTGNWTAHSLKAYLNENGSAQNLKHVRFEVVEEPSFDPTAPIGKSGWYDCGLSGSGAVLGMFKAPHSVPDARGLVTFYLPGMGSLVWMIDMCDPDSFEERAHFAQTLERIKSLPGGVLAVFIDSTAANRSVSLNPTNEEVAQAIHSEMSLAKRLVYFVCFSGDVERIRMAARAAHALGKKFALISGRTLQKSIALGISQKGEDGLAYLDGKVSENGRGFLRIDELEGLQVVSLGEAIKLAASSPQDLICFVAGTQAQGWSQNGEDEDGGEENGFPSALVRLVKTGLSTSRSGAVLRIGESDLFIFSHSVLDGSAEDVGSLRQAILAQGGLFVDSTTNANIHRSGHSNMAWAAALLAPKFVVPIHGGAFERQLMAEFVIKGSALTQPIFVDDGHEIKFNISEADAINFEVASIPSLRRHTNDRIMWSGTLLINFRALVNSQGLVERIYFRAEEDLRSSLRAVDPVLMNRASNFIRGFLACLAASKEFVYTFDQPQDPLRLEMLLKKMLDGLFGDQAQAGKIPWPMVNIIRIDSQLFGELTN